MLFIEADAEACHGKTKTGSSFKNNQYVWETKQSNVTRKSEKKRRKQTIHAETV